MAMTCNNGDDGLEAKEKRDSDEQLRGQCANRAECGKREGGRESVCVCVCINFAIRAATSGLRETGDCVRALSR